MEIKFSEYLKNGFLRVASISPISVVASINENCNTITSYFESFKESSLQIAVFPELFITGGFLGDLFGQQGLDEKINAGIRSLLEKSKDLETVLVIGSPYFFKERWFNSALVIKSGTLLAVVTKHKLSHNREVPELNYFSTLSNNEFFHNREENESSSCIDSQTKVIIGNSVVFSLYDKTKFAITIGDEVCDLLPLSYDLTKAGAELILNLTTSPNYVGKDSTMFHLIKMHSFKTQSAYLSCSANNYSYSNGYIFSGSQKVFENGKELELFNTKDVYANVDTGDNYSICDIDTDLIKQIRRKTKYYSDSDRYENGFDSIVIKPNYTGFQKSIKMRRKFDKNPFLTDDVIEQRKICKEVIEIQIAALTSKLRNLYKDIRQGKVVIGISGGLDSTLALLIVKEVFDRQKINSKNIFTITMPGFGTSDNTYNNAKKMAYFLNTSLLEIPIEQAVAKHFEDITHDKSVHNIVFENAQARERTQILFDYANKVNALVVGTADLSESALGWCTFVGDHLGGYNINAGVPKTVIQEIVRTFVEEVDIKNTVVVNGGEKEGLAEVLIKVLNSDISPELLPSKANFSQKTESVVGPYELVDFFLYYFLTYGLKPEKIILLTKIAFDGKYTGEGINNWCDVFYRRFFVSQYKRSLSSDGVRIWEIGLDPLNWQMPCEVSYTT